MDALAALRLQIAWGADEALDEAPVDRTRPEPLPPRVQPAVAQRAAAAETPKGPAARAVMAAAAAMTREDLRDALTRFTDCPLAATATNLVFFDGNPAASLVFVGDTPGPEEDMSGRPLDGPAGALLDRMLASIGLDRTRVAIVSLIPWRPPGGRPATDTELAMCAPFLLRHLVLLQPRIVVTLGAPPARTLTGSDATLRKLRGTPRPLRLEGYAPEVKLLPMLHPSNLILTPSAKKDAWADLLTLQCLLSAPSDES